MVRSTEQEMSSQLLETPLGQKPIRGKCLGDWEEVNALPKQGSYTKCLNTAVLVKHIDPDFSFVDIGHYQEKKNVLTEDSSHKKRSGYCLQSGIFQVQAMRLPCNSEMLQILQIPFSLKYSRRKLNKVTDSYPIQITFLLSTLANLQAIYFNCPRSTHSSNLALFSLNHLKMKVVKCIYRFLQE